MGDFSCLLKENITDYLMTDDFSCLLHIYRIMWTTSVNACPLKGSIMDYFSCPLRHVVMDYFTYPLRENIMHARTI